MCLKKGSSIQHPTFCGQDFLDIQVHVSYTPSHKKEVLINLTVTNVFIVVKGVLFTPAKGVLAGTTCAYIVKLARCLGLKVQMRDFKVPALQNADEVFITNAPRGIVPVVQVNRKAIGSGRPGKITKMLRSAMLKDTSVIK